MAEILVAVRLLLVTWVRCPLSTALRRRVDPDPLEDIRVRRLRALNAATAAVNRSSNSDEIVETVVEPLLDATGLTCGVLYLRDAGSGRLVGCGERGFRGGLPPGIDVHTIDSASLPSRAFRSDEPVIFDVRDRWRGLGSITDAERRCVQPEGLRSAVICRIGSASESYGVLALCTHEDPGDADEFRETVEFVQTVAGQIAIALDRARLYEDARMRAAESAALYEIGRALNARIDPEEILESVLDFACRSLGLAVCEVELLQPLEHRSDFIGGAQPVPAEPYPCELTVPLSAVGFQLGTLRLSQGEEFSGRQRLLASELADVVAASLWKRRLFCDSRERGKAEERGRLAREIHDTLSQRFYAIQLHLSAVDGRAPGDALHTRHLEAAKSQAVQGLEEARNSVHRMWYSEPSGANVVERISVLAREFHAYSEVPCVVVAEGDVPELPERTMFALVRVVQELLRNVARHAEASTARIELEFVPDLLRLTVIDDGRGMPTADTSQALGFGLRSARERLRKVGGRITVHAAPHAGTRVEIELPVSSR